MSKLYLLALLSVSLFAQDTIPALISSAQTHEDRGEHAQAIADYSRLLKLRPDWVDVLNRRAAEHFKLAHIKESVTDFDRAVELDSAKAPYNWQRGIALYYAGRFEDGSKQFESHQTVNGNDVENAAWRYLCMARTKGVAAARAALLPIEGDTRVPMMQIYALYRGTGTVETVMAAGSGGSGSFYAHLYLGLYFEAAGNAKAAREHIAQAAEYTADNYMADVARVHLKLMK